MKPDTRSESRTRNKETKILHRDRNGNETGRLPVLRNVPGSSGSKRLVAISADASQEEMHRAQEEEIRKLHLLLAAVVALGTESRLDQLMALIADKATEMMGCERTSVFLLDRETQELYSLVAQGLGGLDVKEIRFPVSAGLAGHVARTGESLNVADAYQDQRFNQEFDRRTGFRTRSVLALPLPTSKGEVLGVIQCLNNKDSEGKYVSFDAVDQTFLHATAGLAAVFLENGKLYRDMDNLFEAVVSAVSRAIDDRDPCTSGHSRRVTLYTLNLARAVHACDQPPFDKIRFTRERFRQLRFACLMHDVGKIGVREHILCKADKLTPTGLEVVKSRLELLKERRKIQLLEKALVEKLDVTPLLQAEFAPFAKEIDEAIGFIDAKNKPGFLPDADVLKMQALRDKGWITPEEFIHLSVRRGNLTSSEWEDMRSHVTKSYQMLIRIPWPAELKELPEVAYTHHEKRDGSGYPRQLKGDQIHFDGQMMCVADIYDALTASDRPYKKAMPLEVAKKILVEEEAQKQKMIPELVTLFFEKECFKINEADWKAL